jgi:Bacterial Ig-like domain (group 3)/FG-GAP-like repeat
VVDLQQSAKVFVVGPVLLMSLFSRSLRRSVFSLSCLLSGVLVARQAAAQVPQLNAPTVIPSGNWPANVAAGDVDNTGKTSLLSCDPYSAGGTLACHLYQRVNGAWTATQSYSLAGATAAKAVVVDDPVLGFYGVAILFVKVASPATSSTFTIQYYANGTGSPLSVTGNTPGGAVPVLADFAYRLSTARSPEPGLFIATDSANGYLYTVPITSSSAGLGALETVASSVTGPNPTLCGAILPNLYPSTGPHGGRPAFAVVSTNGTSVGTVSMNPDGTWTPLFPPLEYTGSGSVYSALLADMDGDGVADLVTEGDNGRMDIYQGLTDGTFARVSEGGTGALDGVSGNGGRLVAISDLNGDGIPDILTATPIGLSVLLGQGGLQYTLKGIYDIGPGRSSYALADINGDGHPDLAVDSPEGVAIVMGDANGDGGFQTANAYSALAPGLGAVVGKFRNAANNPRGNLDVAVNTGTFQGQLLTGNGDGTFTTYPSTLVPIGLTISPNVWSNILSGDFNGDGIPDIAYSLTGLPAASVISVLIQYGNGNGTFGAVTGINPFLAGLPANNTLFGESTVGDFNGDGIADIANIDANHDDTLLGQNTLSFKLGLNATAAKTPFDQVAAGFFNVNRTNKQDLVFQEGANFIPYLNSGDGIHFTPASALTGAAAPHYASTVLLTDIDGDGNGDIVALYYNAAPIPAGAGPVSPAQIYIWYGNGDGTFQPPQILSLSRNYYLGAVADMNADGRPDIVLSDGSLVSILYNQGGRSFGAVQSNGELAGEQHFLAGQGINSILLADVNGDGVPDLIVANGGATISNAVVLGGNTLPSISLTPNPVDIDTGGITVLLNNITTKITNGATTTELFLCIGPTPLCPSLGIINPPPLYSANLTMSYGQTWNGTTDAFANDGSQIAGTITLIDVYNGVTLPLCTLLAGQAGACPPSVGTTQGTSVGPNILTSVYSGDSTHNRSTSPSVTITVSPDTTTATLVGAPNPSPAGLPVTFTATLSGNYAAPTGPVNFVELFPPTNTARLLGTATLVPGPGLTSTATFITSTLPLGMDSIQAQYAATLDFDAANSPVFIETITPSLAGNFTLTVTPTPVSVGVGYSTLLTVTVTPQNGFSLGVNLACANLPSEATCFFDTTSVAGGGGTTNLVVATTAPHSCGTTQPYFLGANGGGPGIAPIALPALAGLLAMFLPGRRRWLRALIALAVVAAATQMTGCGNCTDLGTRPATYTFQVTGTSTGTSEVQTQSVTMTVTI